MQSSRKELSSTFSQLLDFSPTLAQTLVSEMMLRLRLGRLHEIRRTKARQPFALFTGLGWALTTGIFGVCAFSWRRTPVSLWRRWPGVHPVQGRRTRLAPERGCAGCSYRGWRFTPSRSPRRSGDRPQTLRPARISCTTAERRD